MVILAAGKSTRLKLQTMPKAMLPLANKPMVSYIVKTLQSLGFNKHNLCLVVGFKKEKVVKYFGSSVGYAIQNKKLGTAHAANIGIKHLPKNINTVLVINADDSAFYKPLTLKHFLLSHLKNKLAMSLLTADFKIPNQFGRIARHKNGGVEIVEKELLTLAQTKIKEINTGTYIFSRSWFNKIYPLIKTLPGLGELGLSTVVAIAHKQRVKYQAVKLKNSKEWFGINTPVELKEADKKMKKLLNK